jgi:hypothetical protein
VLRRSGQPIRSLSEMANPPTCQLGKHVALVKS